MPSEQPVGIFTLSDVLKRIVLPGRSLEQPISSVMSTAPQTLPLAANAHDAALAMAMHGIRHVLAVDEGGRLKGVVSERDLFKLQGAGLRQIRHAIDAATSLEVLQHAREDVRQLSLTMLAEGVGGQEITQFISTLNDTVTRRIIELNLDRHDLYGIDWAWLSFGSEGRDEQTFTTDQDNGIVFICTDIMDREQTQLRFLEFARDVNADLDTCGFPLCKGNIMASNPALCLTLEEWEESLPTGCARRNRRPCSTPRSSSTFARSTAASIWRTGCVCRCSGRRGQSAVPAHAGAERAQRIAAAGPDT
jgi:CBS domain-containing protein